MTKIDKVYSQEFLIDLLRSSIERQCQTTLTNIYIVKSEIHNTDSFYKDGYVRVWWSADNHPHCQKIYANKTCWDLIPLMNSYRQWKLSKVLC